MNKRCQEILQELENEGKIKIWKKFEFPEPRELKLKLKDLLEDEVDEKYYLSDAKIKKIQTSNFMQEKKRIQEKEYCDTLCARDWKDPKCIQVGQLDIKGHDCIKRVYSPEGCSPTLTNMQGGNRQPKILEEAVAVAQRGRYDEFGKVEQQLEISNREIANALTTVQKDSMACLKIKNATKQGYSEAQDGDGVYISAIDKKRSTVQKDKIQTLKTSPDVGVVVGEEKLRIRKLTPKECWRLMGFSDEDFEKAKNIPTSNTQLYKQAGNSIVVNVLEKIFRNLLIKTNEPYKIINDDCLKALDKIENNSIDAIVTDPPYELNFMGRDWDNAGVSFKKETWEKCLDVLKPRRLFISIWRNTYIP